MAAIDTDYVSQADGVIQKLPRDRDRDPLTTSKLRNLMSLTAQIFDEAQLATEDVIPKSLADKVQYLRVRFVYEAGREPAVKAFVKEAKLLDALAEIDGSRPRLLDFCRYMEALVAFKKYHDPQDK